MDIERSISIKQKKSIILIINTFSLKKKMSLEKMFSNDSVAKNNEKFLCYETQVSPFTSSLSSLLSVYFSIDARLII